jgi:DNA-binding MarR family transcriptional regulator
MAMDRATLGHNIRSLKMRGLVRLAAGADLRSRQVTLTPKGHVPLARAGQQSSDAVHDFFATMERLAHGEHALLDIDDHQRGRHPSTLSENGTNGK